MIDKIINFIKEKLIIIIGFFVGILAISIGISIVLDSSEYSRELNFGNYKFSKGLQVQASSYKVFGENKMLDFIDTKSKDSLIIYGSGMFKINDKQVTSDATVIMPVAYKNIRWLPNIIYGRHLTDEETLSNKNLAVIGIDVFNELGLKTLDENSKINLSGKEYSIIGVMGRKSRYLQFNKNIFIPYKSFIGIDKLENNIPLSIYSDKINPESYLQSLRDINDIKISINPEFNHQLSNIDIPYKLVILVGVFILVLTGINMTTTCLCWVHKRKKEFAIRKAIGATDTMLAFLVFREILQLVFIGCVIAFICQIVFTKSIEKFTLNMELDFTILNFIFGLVTVLIFSIISSLIPIKRLSDIDISEEIKN
jgi:putative ABC transport system permease protein